MLILSVLTSEIWFLILEVLLLPKLPKLAFSFWKSHLASFLGYSGLGVKSKDFIIGGLGSNQSSNTRVCIHTHTHSF